MPSIFRSLFKQHKAPKSPRTVQFELVQECNQDCVFCYNVWKCMDYPAGRMDTTGTKDLLDRVINDYKPELISFTGGEPLLRPDLPELVRHVIGRTRCSILTNGLLMTDELANELISSGMRNIQFTLLSHDRDIHNSLVRTGSFDRVIEAIASVRAAGGQATTTFVATSRNIHTFRETIELNVALGVRVVLFNRFNLGGEGLKDGEKLLPTVDQLKDALQVAEEAIYKYGIIITCGVPIPPCVIDMSQYKNIHSVNCPIGTENSYPTIDTSGNVRWCNHSPSIIGNVFDTPLTRIVSSRKAVSCIGSLPEMCNGCKHAETCRGGCRAAAQVFGGDCSVDPFVDRHHQGRVEHTIRV